MIVERSGGTHKKKQATRLASLCGRKHARVRTSGCKVRERREGYKRGSCAEAAHGADYSPSSLPMHVHLLKGHCTCTASAAEGAATHAFSPRREASFTDAQTCAAAAEEGRSGRQ